MFKTFIIGILLGIAASAAASYLLPVVDQHREQSMISVRPNVGNSESFHINIPTDRILLGAPDRDAPLPAGLEWPSQAAFGDLSAELFKLRNERDAVVGVASRMAVSDDAAGDLIEWVLHLPARGSVYVTMSALPEEGGYRVGEVLQGTREFAGLLGMMTERWAANGADPTSGNAGRIELQTALRAVAVDQE